MFCILTTVDILLPTLYDLKYEHTTLKYTFILSEPVILDKG